MLQMMLLGQCCTELMDYPSTLHRQEKSAKGTSAKILSDWKSLGISVQYFSPSKHSQGMLYLTLPSVMPPAAQATIIHDAKVIPAHA